jgi:hypothetical protein
MTRTKIRETEARNEGSDAIASQISARLSRVKGIEGDKPIGIK